MTARLEYRQLRAPAQDGGVFIEPIGDALSEMIQANLANDDCNVSLHGRTLSDLREQARAQLLCDAVAYVGKYRDVDSSDGQVRRPAPQRIYLTGHQPELFHPGVWLKNFVIASLAKRDGAAAVHVLIDNDEVRSPAVRVPSGSLDEPHLETIPLDADAPPCAWEQRTIQDTDTFLTFAERAAQAISPFVKDPLVREIWRAAPAALGVTSNLGRCVAQLRHRTEAAWGLETLEIPLSHICRGESFHWFVAFLMAERRQFAAAHNRRLAEYRKQHRLRSRTHPVPDLAVDGEWLEMPLWIWTRDDPQRRRLFVQHRHHAIVLSDRQSQTHKLTAPADGDVSPLAADLAELESRGIKLRPRALTTTMYLRTVLSDLFVHGIGGAKYDEVTDGLIADLLGIQPPGFVTASGTKLLPIDRPHVGDDELRDVDRELRNLDFHPEQFVVLETIADPREREQIERLLIEKQAVLAKPPASNGPRERHAAISRINAALQNHVSNRRAELLRQREKLGRQRRANDILASREFALCLFSEAGLRPWLLDAAGKAN